jgi:hypothetical protein
MQKLIHKLYGVNWRLALMVSSVLTFAIAGSADDGGGY